MGRTRINEDNLFAAVSKLSAILVCLFSLTGYLLGSARFAAGILAGGILALVNFFWLQNTLRRVLQLQPRQAGSFAQVRYLLRLTFAAFILYLLIVHAGIDIVGLIIGLSVLVVVIMGLSLYMFLGKGE